MKVIRLEDKNNDIFNKICEWNYNWWGIKNETTGRGNREYSSEELRRCENHIEEHMEEVRVLEVIK